MNTNQPFPSKSDPNLKRQYHRLEAACQYIAGHLEQFVYLKPPAVKRGETLSREWIHGTRYNFGIELGPQNHMLHAHISLSVRHSTTIGIDYGAMRSYLSDTLERNVYLSLKVAGSAQSSFENYAGKGGNIPVETGDME